MAAIICPDCKNDNAGGTEFCQKCGRSLTIKCRACGTPNPLGVEFCGNCCVRLSEVTFGIAGDELEKWQDAFASIEWFLEIGPQTKKTLSQLNPPLNPSREPILLVNYNDLGRNHIKSIRIDNSTLTTRDGYLGMIGTNYRILFLENDKQRFYAFPYEDLASVQTPSGDSALKDVDYILTTKSGHTIAITVHFDAPGLLGALAGFHDLAMAGHVLDHRRKAGEVINFLNLYFTRIVP